MLPIFLKSPFDAVHPMRLFYLVCTLIVSALTFLSCVALTSSKELGIF